jgi:hypothetical protein
MFARDNVVLMLEFWSTVVCERSIGMELGKISVMSEGSSSMDTQGCLAFALRG